MRAAGSRSCGNHQELDFFRTLDAAALRLVAHQFSGAPSMRTAVARIAAMSKQICELIRTNKRADSRNRAHPMSLPIWASIRWR